MEMEIISNKLPVALSAGPLVTGSMRSIDRKDASLQQRQWNSSTNRSGRGRRESVSGSSLMSLKAYYRKLRTFKGTIKALINLRRLPTFVSRTGSLSSAPRLTQAIEEEAVAPGPKICEAVGKLAGDDCATLQNVKSQVQDLVDKGHVITEIDTKAKEDVTYRMQGNLEHYTEENLRKRVKLQQHPHMIALTQRLWLTAVHEQEEQLSFGEYEAYMLRLHRLILPEFDIVQSKELIKDDWTRDTDGSDHLDYRYFHFSMFELVDLWTDTVEAEDYISLLYCIMHCLTFVLNDHHFLKSLEDIRPVDILEESKELSIEEIERDLAREVNGENAQMYRDRVNTDDDDSDRVRDEGRGSGEIGHQAEEWNATAGGTKTTTSTTSTTSTPSQPDASKYTVPRKELQRTASGSNASMPNRSDGKKTIQTPRTADAKVSTKDMTDRAASHTVLRDEGARTSTAKAKPGQSISSMNGDGRNRSSWQQKDFGANASSRQSDHVGHGGADHSRAIVDASDGGAIGLQGSNNNIDLNGEGSRTESSKDGSNSTYNPHGSKEVPIGFSSNLNVHGRQTFNSGVRSDGSSNSRAMYSTNGVSPVGAESGGSPFSITSFGGGEFMNMVTRPSFIAKPSTANGSYLRAGSPDRTDSRHKNAGIMDGMHAAGAAVLPSNSEGRGVSTDTYNSRSSGVSTPRSPARPSIGAKEHEYRQGSLLISGELRSASTTPTVHEQVSPRSRSVKHKYSLHGQSQGSTPQPSTDNFTIGGDLLALNTKSLDMDLGYASPRASVVGTVQVNDRLGSFGFRRPSTTAGTSRRVAPTIVKNSSVFGDYLQARGYQESGSQISATQVRLSRPQAQQHGTPAFSSDLAIVSVGASVSSSAPSPSRRPTTSHSTSPNQRIAATSPTGGTGLLGLDFAVGKSIQMPGSTVKPGKLKGSSKRLAGDLNFGLFGSPAQLEVQSLPMSPRAIGSVSARGAGA